MAVLFSIGVALAAGIAIGAYAMRRSTARHQRESYIRGYVFSNTLLNSLTTTYPDLQERDAFLVARALRSFFLVHLRAGAQTIAMPSKVVDALWHEFILDTREYHRFCEQAFGRYFHHIPAAQVVPGVAHEASMHLTWRLACLEENINPQAATRLPLLFAIDQKLAIPQGNTYSFKALKKGDAGGGCGGLGCGASGCGGGGGCGGGCGGL